jgi:dipeptidyl aminopeptidase/acylaminoacyl peptidase
VEEDYNLPPCLVCKETDEQERILYQSNKVDRKVLSLRQEIISYTAGDGILLKGILYYPLNFTPGAKYPMVVHIYEEQRQSSNRYPFPSYYEELGFNIRLLIEGGYFVFLPDILIQGIKGPGVDALESVESALDAVSGNLLIDSNKIGLIGHSFGAYETDFIATHSKRFAAYVSGAGQSDLVWAYHSFNYNFKWPDYLRIEDNQHKMGVPFSGNRQLYFMNNPIYYADQVNAPVLLWSGLNDQNVTSDHTMAFYNALRRNNKEVIALYYKDQGHSIRQPLSQVDLTSRILDWFDYFLKENTEIEWIRDGIRKKKRAP